MTAAKAPAVRAKRYCITRSAQRLRSAAMTGPLDPGVGEGELDSARRLGERVARLAAKLKRAETKADVKQ